ncbi:uncharacterized protein SOCE26_007430 [Sorangium cellulosum]|uniref:Uncharacterized protein n=1 Tax=Sorangium cellulosum TaxID=56 RepID=A0A2L0EJB2_SORCE|nr:hypothetical protein [Sorangium cellulosum]AUX39354.1 uncharacterized protein SOCE26_007430 [Sorangium cellulosum]
MSRDPRAARSLVHPLWLGALALLVLNDHAFKGAGLLPGWLTGKLSDFAGLLVAPVVLASLLGVSSRRGFLGAHVATGAVFSAIKLAPAAARAVEALMALTPVPWRITVDPTDLIALPMLLVSYRVLGEVMRRPEPARPVAHRLALMAGSLACVATSRETPPCDGGASCVGPLPAEPASLVIGNTTEEEQLIRVRRLRESVQVDCGALLADPTGALSRDLFANAETWLIAPGRALPLQNAGCDAFLIDAAGLPLTLLAWSEADFPTQLLTTVTQSPPPDVMIVLQRAGARLELAEHPAVFPAPPAELPTPAGACGASFEGGRLDWTTSTSETAVVAGVTSSPDGCHAIATEGGDSFYLCVPAEAMPIQAGDTLRIADVGVSGGRYPELLPGQQASATGIYIESEAYALLALRGNVLARWAMAGRSSPAAEFSAALTPFAECEAFHDACGSLVAPLEASLLGEGVSGIVTLRAGESAPLADGAGTLHLVRADDMPVRDAACFTAPLDQPRQLESVLVAAPAAP